MKRTRLNRISARRLLETDLYCYRIRQFLLLHPYCQVWLAENNIPESHAIQSGGVVTLTTGSRVSVPLATQVHHMNKRRGADLLNETQWLAVSSVYHREIEEYKTWARAKGYLLDI